MGGETESADEALLVPPPPPPGEIIATQPNSGWTEGTFSVNHNGAAEYHLPLWVPDGRRGLQPELALHYNSGGGNGLVGVGWSLQGFSTITPCPRTIAQDGRTEGVSFTADDVYCLDGQRLRPVGANGWPTNLEREYRTERETFTKIVSYTPPPVIPAQLQTTPDYFTVWTKDGHILTFGGNGDADYKAGSLFGIQPENPAFASGGTVRVAWALRTAQDRTGNAINFEYAHVDTGHNLWEAEQMMPERITYGPDRRIEFIYEARPDSVDLFQTGRFGGAPTGLAQRLKTVQMYAATELLREYRLTYQNDSITARSLLSSISECDPNGVCLNPLEFDWSMGSYQFADIETDVTDVGSSAASGHRFIASDINGDGADDLIYGDETNAWKMRFSNGLSGFSAAQSMGIPNQRGPNFKPIIRPVDFNRDSRIDLTVEMAAGATATRLVLYRSQGSSFEAQSPLIDDLPIGPDGIHSTYFVDLDGNGRSDYLGPQRVTDTVLQWRYRLSFGSHQFSPMQVAPILSLYSLDGQHQIRATDFDGDGRGDLLVQNAASGKYERIGLGENGLWKSTDHLNLPFSRIPQNEDRTNLHFADVNGDGLEDAIYPYSGLQIQLNSGRGFSQLLDGPTEYVSPEPISDSIERGVRIGDFNNDGADDVLIVHKGAPTGPEAEGSPHRRGVRDPNS